MNTRRSDPSTGGLLWAFLILVFLLSPILLIRTAVAQGTTGTLPDPISSRELIRYAERLILTDHQRQAMESVHDRYKTRFRDFRDGKVAEFLDEMRAMQGMGVMPKKEVAEAFLPTW